MRCPRTRATIEIENDRLLDPTGNEVGRIEQGILRIPVPSPDEGIAYYRSIGGTHFHERSTATLSMSALDTPVYHRYLQDVRPQSPEDVIVDIGGGDGRNTLPWLQLGYRRIVLVDAVFDALLRFRERLIETMPDALGSIAFVEADARALPLADGCAATVLAIESLYYLNEDYELGLSESIRVLGKQGKILLSERDYEGGLVMRLLYHGIDGMLESAGTRSLYDGQPGGPLVRTRCFTEAELLELLRSHDLQVLSVGGTSLLALLLGWMRTKSLLDDEESRVAAVRALLNELARKGQIRRCHVIVAEKRSGEARRCRTSY